MPKKGGRKAKAGKANKKGKQETETKPMDQTDGKTHEGLEQGWKFARATEEEDDGMMCQTDGCGVKAAALWVCSEAPAQKFYCCVTCQENRFQGFPDQSNKMVGVDHGMLNGPKDEQLAGETVGNATGNDSFPESKEIKRTEEPLSDESQKKTDDLTFSKGEIPSSPLNNTNINDIMLDRPKDSVASPQKGIEAAVDTSGSAKDQKEDSRTEEGGEQYDLFKVLTLEDLESGVVCTICAEDATETGEEPTFAATIWKGEKTGDKYYYCLDCQDAHYAGKADDGGWGKPEKIPLDYMTEEHKTALLEKCCKNPETLAPKMPKLPSPATEARTPIPVSKFSNTVTPVPQNGLPLHDSSAMNVGDGVTVTPLETKPKKKQVKAKPSKQQMAKHAEWQAEAEKHAGKGARLVMDKATAQKMVFETLHDSFAPMTITQISFALKRVVPPPALKSALDDMVIVSASGNVFADSDDEEGDEKATTVAAKKKDKGSKKGSLLFKAGRSAEKGIYYVDYSQLQNNGNGLDFEEKNKLYSDLEVVKQTKASMVAKLSQNKATETQLLSEPTNAGATALLEKEEASFAELMQEVESARGLKANEKVKTALQGRSQKMAHEWNKRRRKCMDALMTLEEMTEGTISVKKCLKGDGQIDVDSDEMVIMLAKDFHAKQALRPTKRLKSSKKDTGVQATKSFIAVDVDKQGRVTRVHLDQD